MTAITRKTDTFTSATTGAKTLMTGAFNVSVDFTTGSGVGTVALQRSFDDGVTWKTVKTYTSGAEELADCPDDVLYRFNCTAYTSGTIKCIMSQRKHNF